MASPHSHLAPALGFDDLFLDMLGLIATCLDPASKKSLALTSKNNLKIFNDPDLVGQFFADEIIRAGHLELLTWALEIGVPLDSTCLSVAASPSTPNKPGLSRILFDLYNKHYFYKVGISISGLNSLWKLIGMSGETDLITQALSQHIPISDLFLKSLAEGLAHAPNFSQSWETFCTAPKLRQGFEWADGITFLRFSILPEALAHDLVETLVQMEIWEDTDMIRAHRGLIMPNAMERIFLDHPTYLPNNSRKQRRMLAELARLSPVETVRVFLKHCPKDFFDNIKGTLDADFLSAFITPSSLEIIKTIEAEGLFHPGLFEGLEPLRAISEASDQPEFLELVKYFLSKCRAGKELVDPIVSHFLSLAHHSLNVPYLRFVEAYTDKHLSSMDRLEALESFFIPLIKNGLHGNLRGGADYFNYVVTALGLEKAVPLGFTPLLKVALARPLKIGDVSLIYLILTKLDQDYLKQNLPKLISVKELTIILGLPKFKERLLPRSVRIREVVVIATKVLKSQGAEMDHKQWTQCVTQLGDRRLREALSAIGTQILLGLQPQDLRLVIEYSFERSK